MIGLTRRDPNIVRATVPESKVKWLGRAADGYDYAVHDGLEYAVDPHASKPEDYARRPGELYVMRVWHEVIDGSKFEHHATHRAQRVPDGTYAALDAKASKRAAEKPMRMWGVLAALPVMQRREPTRMAAGVLSASALDTLEHLPAQTQEQRQVIAGAVDLLHHHRPPAVIEVGGNEPPERGPVGWLKRLASHGVELTLARGRLLARSVKPIRFDDRQLIDKGKELIVGVLSGSPVTCSTCAEPAIDIAYPDAPMCTEHLT